MTMTMEPHFYTGEAAADKYKHTLLMIAAGFVESALCREGEHIVFFLADKAYGPGHIYSEAGAGEFGITKWCEWHFDSFTPEDD
jgi:hypothetical protein